MATITQVRNFEPKELEAARTAVEALVDNAALEAAVAAALAKAGATIVSGTFGVALAVSPCGEGEVIAVHLTWEHGDERQPTKGGTGNVWFAADEIAGGSLEKLYHQRVDGLMREITKGYQRAA